MTNATSSIRVMTKALRSESAMVRPREDRRAGHRQRPKPVDHPLAEADGADRPRGHDPRDDCEDLRRALQPLTGAASSNGLATVTESACC